MTTTASPEPNDNDKMELQSQFHNTNYNIEAHQFERVISELPAIQQDTLRFWFFLGKERGWSLAKLAKTCGSSSTTLSRVFRGDYGAGLEKICGDLARARDNFAEGADNPDFIHTSLAKKFFRIADRTRAMSTVSIMWGAMGIGKTAVATEYKRLNNHGRTIYYRCSPGLSFAQFVAEIAAASGVVYKKFTQLRTREKLFALLAAGNRLLIVDELHQLFIRREKNDTTAILQCEFLREIYDRSGCGLVLIGTRALETHLHNQREALAQLLDRGTMQINLGDKPSAGDLRLFIANYGLPDLNEREPEASAIVADTLKLSGLRLLTLRLRDGAAAAAKAGEPYAWKHFCAAFKAISSLSK